MLNHNTNNNQHHDNVSNILLTASRNMEARRKNNFNFVASRNMEAGHKNKSTMRVRHIPQIELMSSMGSFD